MTEMFGEAWSPMSVPDLAPDDDDDYMVWSGVLCLLLYGVCVWGVFYVYYYMVWGGDLCLLLYGVGR